MSYQVLARKWRPRNFDEVTGQEHVTTALRNALRSDRVSHAILLTGPRGVGKTTLARILARCLNCDKGPSEMACGECTPCREIAAGTSTDVQEIDAASRTSVDDVRELIEAIRYAPSPGKHRIFVVDEVHMLSTPAFNALLKTLEEPPPRSLFVLATTNPEKIPHTVVSRCQRYDLRRIQSAQVISRLGQIAREEGIEVSEESLLALARESEGSLRDAVTLLDQLVAYGGARIEHERVIQVLDLIDRRLLLAVATACVEADPARALEACGHAAEAGVDPRRLGAALLQMLRDLVALRVAPDVRGLVEGSDAEIEELTALAARTEPLRLRRMFRTLMKEQEDLAWAPQPFAVLEMAVVRLATLAPGDDVARLLERLDRLERRLAGGDVPPPARGDGGGGRGPAARRSRGADAGAPSRSRGGPPASASEDAGARQAAPEDTRPGSTPLAALDADDAAPAEGAGADAGDDSRDAPPHPDAPLPVVYDRLRAVAEGSDRGLAAALADAALCERSSRVLGIRAATEFAARRLESRRLQLEALCTRVFGAPLRVRIDPPDASAPQAGGPKPAPDALRRLRQQALEHPGVNAAREILGGEIVEIRPQGDAG